MSDRTAEATSAITKRFLRWLPGKGEPCVDLAIRFLTEEGYSRSWKLPTWTRNTYALWKEMSAIGPGMEWSELKRRADDGFAAERSCHPHKPRYGKPKRLSVALADWPETFRLAWQAHLSRKRRRASRLDEVGQSPERSETEATAEHAFAEFVGAMRRAGRAVEVTRETIQKFVDQKREQKRPCKPRSIGNLLAGILKVARVAGIEDLDWLLATSLDKKAEKDPSRKAKRLIEPGDIVDGGMELIARARSKLLGSRDGKLLFRDGLLFVLVAHFPFRRKNLSEARLGHNIIRLEDGRYRISFSVWEMKKWNEVEYETDPPLARLIDEFIEVHRPWFLGGRQDLGYLFPSAVSSNGRLGGDAILRRFKKRSRKMPCGEFGCHDVRRHVASAMMRKSGDERAVAAMLQHESVGTVGTYARLRDAAAASQAMRDANRAIYQGLERNRRQENAARSFGKATQNPLGRFCSKRT